MSRSNPMATAPDDRVLSAWIRRVEREIFRRAAVAVTVGRDWRLEQAESGDLVAVHSPTGAVTVLARRVANAGAAITVPNGWRWAELESRWTWYGGAYAQPAFRRFDDGLVMLRGSLSTVGAAQFSTIFTLPPGYRPRDRLMFPRAAETGGCGQVEVDPDGEVIANGFANGPLMLDGIVFDAWPHPDLPGTAAESPADHSPPTRLDDY